MGAGGCLGKKNVNLDYNGPTCSNVCVCFDVDKRGYFSIMIGSRPAISQGHEHERKVRCRPQRAASVVRSVEVIC